jgi:hypothetical protein
MVIQDKDTTETLKQAPHSRKCKAGSENLSERGRKTLRFFLRTMKR